MISPELQLTAITDECARSNYQIVGVLTDIDLSGRFWKRRQVDAAIGMIEAGEADILMVWKWSRVARNRLDWAIAVDRVESAGGVLQSATEPLDASTTTGRFARGVLAEFAAFESDRMSDVWMEVQRRRIRNGLPIDGKPRFGYIRSGEGYVVDPVTGPILRVMYRRRIRGEGAGQIGDWLTSQGILGPNPDRVGEPRFRGCSVDAVLTSGFGAGLLRRHGEYLAGSQPAVITNREWKAFRAIQPRARKAPLSKDDYPLYGLAWCCCGDLMAPVSNGVHLDFRCPNHEGVRYRKACVLATILDETVRAWLGELAIDNDVHAVASRWAEARAADARVLTRRASAGEVVLADLDQAITDSRCGDPRSLAEDLLEDWDALDVARRRAGLSHVIRRIDVRTGRYDRCIQITPRWLP